MKLIHDELNKERLKMEIKKVAHAYRMHKPLFNYRKTMIANTAANISL